MVTSCTVVIQLKKNPEQRVSVFDLIAFYILVGVVPAVFQEVVCISNMLRLATVVLITSCAVSKIHG